MLRLDWRTLLAITGIVFGIYSFRAREIKRPPGMMVAETPLQKNYDPPILKFTPYKGTLIEPLAEFEMKARVLSTERYQFDPPSFLAPIDVAVGWGPMSDSAIIDQLHVSQRNRFFFYRWNGEPPLDPQTIIRSASNMHLIPSSDLILKVIEKLKPGHLIFLAGDLVRVHLKDGNDWKSSLTRDDTGNGACEVIYVKTLQIIK